MNKLIIISALLFAYTVPVEASDLRACPKDPTKPFLNCFGAYTTDDGGKYFGEWQNDKYNGNVSMIYSNGDKYIGGFKDNALEGNGVYIFSMAKNLWENLKLKIPMAMEF
tara:strand:+ start:42 stop:371 length:330 start_codon:yes stop_codon:yes gene_type:complete